MLKKPSLSCGQQQRSSSPYINHFLQPDPIIPDLSNPQSWNRYSYVTNRPINFNDPTGHWVNETNDPLKEKLGDAKEYARERVKRNKAKEKKEPYFVKSPVSKEDLEWTQWFGPTEYAFLHGEDWNYDGYCMGYHCGIDFGGDWGDPVSAGVYGQVVDVDTGDGGFYVIVQRGDYQILYQALDGNFQVAEGQNVYPDTILAGIGNHAADPNGGNTHLHLEVRHSSSGNVDYKNRIANPLLFMDHTIYQLLTSVVPNSPPNNITFHGSELDPLKQFSPIHRGAAPVW